MSIYDVARHYGVDPNGLTYEQIESAICCIVYELSQDELTPTNFTCDDDTWLPEGESDSPTRPD